MDREHARLVEAHLKQHGVNLALGDGVAGFKQAANGSLVVDTKSGKTHPADLVILALGVRPDTTLAKQAGLAIGERGGIRVDEHMRTSHPDIFAVGDAVEVKDFVTGQWSLIALAIQMGATIYDLEEAELCYAPQFGSAKDPVNFAGMIAGDVLRGDMPICHWDAVNGAFLLDVRQPAELALESAPGAVHIPHRGTPGASGRVAARPRDSCYLPLRPARLLRDARAVAAWVQSPKPFRRIPVPRDPLGGFRRRFRTRRTMIRLAMPDSAKPVCVRKTGVTQ
jgi:hypothetical protein